MKQNKLSSAKRSVKVGAKKSSHAIMSPDHLADSLGGAIGIRNTPDTPRTISARTESHAEPDNVGEPQAPSDAHSHDDGRKAVHVDGDARARNLTRLRRIEGQVRGLQKMVEDDRYCADIMTQIASVHEALRSVGRELMRNHLKHCATGAIQAGEPAASAMYDELVDMMYKHSR